MRDLHNDILVTSAINPAVKTTDNTAYVSAILDTLGYESAEFIVITGTLTDADATFALLFEEGDNSSLTDHAEVAANDLLGTESGASFTFADDNKTLKIGYKGKRRYLRVTITPSANTGDVYLAAVWVQGHPKQAPNTTQKN